ncbi:SMP-30/gluconolactonase/LRE family protein [Sphingomonas sp. IC-56]|uniref:SMP-30/gluconolactonase/LRE family protein n=1 Tax=Sphingomonas sp. IC-56 TaxID=2898529 RepID=UPI001E3B5BD9|nr:SMP-30/gluconolactonase/LRE family protein [Sphingomonas sp. IC-56]MCD2324037.1 SMP-30/gluconolactonase/LRE family protein [Sphingomonas sp. IC-56]
MHLSRRACLAAAAALPLAARAHAYAPQAPAVQRFDPELDRILATDAKVEVIASGYRWTEGPVWVRDGGYLLFSDVPANIVHRWQPGRGAAPFLQPSGLVGPIPAAIREAGANGLAIDAQGRLVMADSGTRAIARVDLKTKRKTILADRYAGKRFNSCNDVVIARSGAIYFTDPPYGLAEGDTSPLKEMKANGVYRLATDGRVTQLDGSLTRPNGIGLSPDERTLYVAQSDEQRPVLLAYPLDAQGRASPPRVLVDFRQDVVAGLPGLPDGMEVAASGHLFASGPGGIHVLAPDGRRLGLISTGKAAANCNFGEDGRTLFITSSDSVVRVRLKLSGW